MAAKTEGAASDQDLSMEEILQSIRKIIAEDGEEAKDSMSADTPAKPAANGAKGNVPGSEVLELTEMLKDDGSVESLKPAAAEAPKEMPPTDVLSTIDEALGTAKPAAAAAPAPAAPVPTQTAAPAAKAAADTLLSDQAALAAAASMKKFQAAAEPPLPPLSTTPSPVMASGKTVEQMVIDMLRPMMKEWLDKNLPKVVENIVEREVRRLNK